MITLFKIIIMIIPTINTITLTATLINISTKVVVVDSSLANQSLSLNSGEVLKVRFTKMWFPAISNLPRQKLKAIIKRRKSKTRTMLLIPHWNQI